MASTTLARRSSILSGRITANLSVGVDPLNGTAPVCRHRFAGIGWQPTAALGDATLHALRSRLLLSHPCPIRRAEDKPYRSPLRLQQVTPPVRGLPPLSGNQTMIRTARTSYGVVVVQLLSVGIAGLQRKNELLNLADVERHISGADCPEMVKVAASSPKFDSHPLGERRISDLDVDPVHVPMDRRIQLFRNRTELQVQVVQSNLNLRQLIFTAYKMDRAFQLFDFLPHLFRSLLFRRISMVLRKASRISTDQVVVLGFLFGPLTPRVNENTQQARSNQHSLECKESGHRIP